MMRKIKVYYGEIIDVRVLKQRNIRFCTFNQNPLIPYYHIFIVLYANLG